MRCRLFYVVGQLRTGGLERQLFYLLQAMDRERYQPAVAVWSCAENETYVAQIRNLGVPLYLFPRTFSAATKLARFRQLVGRLVPEVVHSYSFYTNIAAWWATLGLTTIPIGSIRNNFLRDRQDSGKILGRLSARWPASQICNSAAAEKIVEDSVGPFKPAQLRTVLNGLDMNRFKPNPILPPKPTLLALGRLDPEKRWDRLLKAMASVATRKLEFSVRHAGEGALLPELAAQAGYLGVDKLINFLGLRHDIAELLADSSFLIHTADEEGCPNVVMEAMACGRAVIATDAGDVPSLVEDGKTGFVIRRGDDAMLVERMATLIIDHDLCRRMGEAGRAKAEREFGLDRLVSDTLAAYRAAGWKDAWPGTA
jgi:glycosyltransferase involved in cell wall biosynthesis